MLICFIYIVIRVWLHQETMDFFCVKNTLLKNLYFFLPLFIILSDIEESSIRFSGVYFLDASVISCNAKLPQSYTHHFSSAAGNGNPTLGHRKTNIGQRKTNIGQWKTNIGQWKTNIEQWKTVN